MNTMKRHMKPSSDHHSDHENYSLYFLKIRHEGMLLNAHGLSSLFKIGRKVLFNMGGFGGNFGRSRVIK